MKKIVSGLIFSACLCAVSTTVLADPPVAQFYAEAQKIAPTGKLGEVVKKEKIKTSVKGAQAWKIAYISSDYLGNKTIATGLVVAPVGPAPKEGRPIMGWAHGTTGTAQNCGPSQILDPVVPLNEFFLIGGNSWTDYGIPSVEEFIAQGYVIAATDYQGLGGGGRHQYSLANTNGKDALNSVRAASSMKETGAGKKAALYGWSQGGGAVLAVTSMPEYVAQKGTAADGIELVGTIALAPYDNAAVVPKLPTTEAEAQKVMDGFIEMFTKTVFDFGHMSMALWAMEPAFPDLKLNQLFTDDAIKAMNEIYSNKCMHTAAATLNYNFGDGYKNLIKAERTNTLGWVTGIVKASNPPVKPIAPVVIYWGTGDVTNPPIMGKLYQEQMCQLGASVDRVQLPGVQTHFTTPGVSGPFYRDWVKDRFADKPATNNCAIAAQLPIK